VTMSMKNALKVTPVGDRELVITRDFNAPRSLVWETMSKPELLKRWLFGPPGWEMTTCEEDARVGGKFRWEWKGPEGAAMSMSGEYIEIIPPPSGRSAPSGSTSGARRRWASSLRR
jgi:uncharacterized protein YndB with AHSA1/START domain